MPIYEFYCAKCHCIYQFFSRRVETEKFPDCPNCGPGNRLRREISLFAITGRAREPGAEPDLPFDESRLEAAMAGLAAEAEGMNDEDPRQAAQLMRRFSAQMGLPVGSAMEEALRRMEGGEDPDQVEAEMGDRLDAEDPFQTPGQLARALKARRPPRRDETLYDLE